MGGASVRSRSVLVVDDDPAVHKLLSGVLVRDGRVVQDAYNSRDALSRLRVSACDVVVAGSGRNGLDGLRLLPRIRALRPAARVIVTGEPDPTRAIGALRRRAFSYLHKPLAPGPMADIVQQAFEATSWQDDLRVVSAVPEWLSLDIRCKMQVAERTVQFLREALSDLPVNTREDVGAAFRELLMNAIEHGARSDPRKRVRASLVRTSWALIGHVHDPGPGFSLDFLPHAAISNPDAEPTRHVDVRVERGQRPGGFGILMTRGLVDELVYNERGNAALFVKRVPNRSPAQP